MAASIAALRSLNSGTYSKDNASVIRQLSAMLYGRAGRIPHLTVVFLPCILGFTLLVPLSVLLVIGVLGCSFGKLQPLRTNQTDSPCLMHT